MCAWRRCFECRRCNKVVHSTIHIRIQGKECNLIAVLDRRLADVSQAEGAVSLEYLRGHVQRLDGALAKAGQIGLRDEALLDSAVAELESSKLILRHAKWMQSCINNSPLKGCGAGMKGAGA